MIVFFATSNTMKVEDAKDALKHYGIHVRQLRTELSESRSEDPAKIALEKAKQAYAKFKKPVIVEDSGFFIHALSGFPMTHIRFSLSTLGVKNILKMLSGAKNRNAEWRMSLVYVYGKNKHRTFTFVEKGVIADSIRPVRRKIKSDYWRIYIPKMIKNDKTLSQMIDKDLRIWEEYYRTNNQFQMFGKWYQKRSVHNIGKKTT
ncbi:MAG TPA: non-canonical purine NTP pyrophosphatase [Patescibacteria group bacterium]|nr:non-canonical purine NTP pyrophosphatase [Patescibacteria group bacterium]